MKTYITKIFLHGVELRIESSVSKGHSGDRLTPPDPDEIVIEGVYVEMTDITILIEEGDLMEEVQRLTEEKYHS